MKNGRCGVATGQSSIIGFSEEILSRALEGKAVWSAQLIQLDEHMDFGSSSQILWGSTFQ